MDKQNNQTYYMVKEFHEAFNHLVSDKPTPIPLNVALPRAVWTAEELVEFLYATVGGDIEQFLNSVEELHEGIGKAVNKILAKGDKIDDIIVAQADALTDVEYFNQGSFVILGVEPFNLFKIVQEANMSKLFPDGKPRYREGDGKIIKPELWEAPEPKLAKEIERQINEK